MSSLQNHTTDPEYMYRIIYDTYKDRIFFYIAGRIKDRNDVLDIFQNVFVHLWQYRHDLGKKNTENIIFKTCNQEIVDFIKNKYKNPTTSSYSDRPDDSSEALNDKLQRETLLQSVESNINMLPAARKQIFTMYKLNGISQQQIADELNMSKKGVKKQIEKAMVFLRNNIKNS
ncbi:hypothetical protein DRF65_13915 [Chryseobacterium pennae]|uniref:RNA polymerase sigma factor 70 region 4 type 2 domain-containing protein n=1 Tax=Chryseobacterium pennae TaxID=2258962 RepID=A0A3D9C7V5_9FLAO|nr:sigma-70 family RNA polymerase sigma factor [Chryseobacterium pennae]REC61829.1 hypothetical protein DRF65_13915 [Chryseobacterium pennae]